MLAKDLIEDLQDLLREHGNLQVIMDDESTPSVEFNDDDDPPGFVIS
jgi:hypothetical protein